MANYPAAGEAFVKCDQTAKQEVYVYELLSYWMNLPCKWSLIIIIIVCSVSSKATPKYKKKTPRATVAILTFLFPQSNAVIVARLKLMFQQWILLVED